MKKIGLDLVDISRFNKHIKMAKEDAFLNKAFTEYEIGYCMAYKDSSSHFAGLLAAKEAVSKALGVRKYPWALIEIRHTKDGKPSVYKKGKKLRVEVSISHTKTMAAAVALA